MSIESTNFSLIVRALLVCFLPVLMAGCEKLDVSWDLERNNSFDVNYNEPCQQNNGETLNNITTFVDKISSSSTAVWAIGEGYKGKGFVLSQPSYGGYIAFPINISTASKLTFWTKSLNPGFSNRMPEVTINGAISNLTMIDGSVSYTNWMQLETQKIPPGNYNVRIDFTHVSVYYSYYVDEITVWCE
jgi:hypothetical protein